MKQPRLTLAISPQALKMLERLAACGIYGRGVAGVAREFLYAGLRAHLTQDGRVRSRPA